MTYKKPNAQRLNGISLNFFQISRPVHVIFKSDKLDYFRSPSQQKNFFHFFSFKTASSNPGKWNWHLLSSLPFIFIFPQCVQLRSAIVFLDKSAFSMISSCLKVKQFRIFEAFVLKISASKLYYFVQAAQALSSDENEIWCLRHKSN